MDSELTVLGYAANSTPSDCGSCSASKEGSMHLDRTRRVHPSPRMGSHRSLLLGLLFARVLAGTISNFVSWRYIYWMAVGLQGIIFIILYFTLPDFPPKQRNLKYHQILWTMGKFMLTEPVLVQACLNGMLTSAVFASFWTTLTFLLGNDPYNYSRYFPTPTFN
jgi:MFS family permease